MHLLAQLLIPFPECVEFFYNASFLLSNTITLEMQFLVPEINFFIAKHPDPTRERDHMLVIDISFVP